MHADKAMCQTVDRQTVEALLALGPQGPQPKTVIYTSGVWVYGNTGSAQADETSPLNPPRQVARRQAVEQLVLAASGVRVVVIRPGCVHGRQGGLTDMWFAGGPRRNRSKRSLTGATAGPWSMPTT